MKPHKHAELIKAWADGAKVQIKPRVHNAWIDVDNPCWYDDEEYRIKPEPKPDFNKHYLVFTNRIYSEGDMFPIRGWSKPNLKLTFDGETGELKSAEVLK